MPDTKLKRILYIQYTNPAGYPPLEHSSRILADSGWQVLFLGTCDLARDPMRFPPHPNIAVRYMNFCQPGWRQKLHYFAFCLWVLCRAITWRPRWIYASDVLSCPAALALTWIPWLSVLYHEHDSPDAPPRGAFQRTVRWTRRKLAHHASLCVLPNAGRLARFKTETGTDRQVFCVWNCPRTSDAASAASSDTGLRLYYHGAIGPDYVPYALIEALAQLPDAVRLQVIGYETVGSTGYSTQVRELARRLGVENRVEVHGALPRLQLMNDCRRNDVGLAFTPLRTLDINHLSRAGASNKPFDYLACGLALLVSDLPDWRATYVDPGYALACNPEDPQSIARSIRRFLDDPSLARTMGEKGRQRILSDWNYETCFQPVLQCLQS